MKYKFIFIFACFLLLNGAKAQLSDTILNMVLSKPYFYNLIKGKSGDIYAGTSDGIVEISKTGLRQYGSKAGYITLNEAGKPVIDTSGIRFYKEKKYVYLLPYPEMAREEYHAGAGNYFYICSGGRLYIFDILSYEYSYPNHSIRTISKDFVGTYSGIYFKGRKLVAPVPPFTDGFIRQFGKRAFICNYNLSVFEEDALETQNPLNDSNFLSFNPAQKTFINDIFTRKDGDNYYLATQNRLLLVDYDLTRDSVLFTHNHKDHPVHLITGNKYYLYFTAKEELFSLDYSTGNIVSMLKLNVPILDGFFHENQTFLLSDRALYRWNSGQQLEKLTNLEKAHTMAMISGSEIIISSDLGLYLFNIASRTLSVVVKGVEFNRKALYVEDNAVHIGSVNGMYKISFNDIPGLIEDNQTEFENFTNSNYLVFIIGFSVFLMLIFSFVVFRLRKKLKQAQSTIAVIKNPEVSETLTREKLEAFIMSNLPNASIRSVMDEFKLNASQLYDLLKPDRPGLIIQQLRMSVVRKMREEGRSKQEISDATGLSISYLKKLKG